MREDSWLAQDRHGDYTWSHVVRRRAAATSPPTASPTTWRARARVRSHHRRLGRGPPRRCCSHAAMFGPRRALGTTRWRMIIVMDSSYVIERGERAQMSKRRGEFVTLDELLDDIGVDATRFFMLMRSHDSTVDLDLELAREQSATTRSTTCSTRTPGSPASCERWERAQSTRRLPLTWGRFGGRWSRLSRPRPAARVPRRSGGGGRAPSAAPHLRLCGHRRRGLSRLLSRLPRRRRRRRRGAGVARRALRRHQAGDRPLAWAARVSARSN